jgi:hypothetical protein
MAKQSTKSAANDIRNLLDPQGYQDVVKTWASTNERMMSLAVASGTRATDIASESAKETFSNVRDLTQTRDEPAAYGQAFADFLQKQTELFTRTVQAYAAETQKVGGETAELVSKAGEDVTNKIAATTEGAVKTARSAAV